MSDSIDFYSYRGNIVFSDQVTIFNLGLENNSETKNKIFNKFFEELKNRTKLDSKFNKRVYYLIFINQYDSIVHCQLARQREYNKYEMTEEKVIGKKEKDYPYVNIFIELYSQKNLIESNETIFENYNTCSDVIQNIMNKHINVKDTNIRINPILKEDEFWDFFKGNNKVSMIDFSLCVPNLFDADNDAVEFLKESNKNVGASNVSLKFSNSKGELKPNKKGIDSFIKYISAGGGKWKLIYKNKEGKSKRVNSKSKSIKISIPISKDLLSNTLTIKEINIIKNEMKKIETMDKFKEE